MSRSLPRPPSLTFAAVALLVAAVDWFVQGMYYTNLYYHDIDPKRLLVPLVALPVVLAACGTFLLRGRHWARFAFWFVAGPFWIWCALGDFATFSLLLVGPAVVLISAVLATPNAHWYFTGRDYTRRWRTVRRRRRVVQIVGPKSAGRSSDFKY